MEIFYLLFNNPINCYSVIGDLLTELYDQKWNLLLSVRLVCNKALFVDSLGFLNIPINWYLVIGDRLIGLYVQK